MFLNDIQLPEFVNDRHVQGVAAHIFDSPTCPYGVILGRDFLKAIGLKMDFENDCIQWLDTIIEMKNIKMYDGQVPDEADTMLHTKQSVYFRHLQQFANEEEASDFDEYLCDKVYAAEILQRKYQSMSTEEVAKLQTHLIESQ